MRRMSHPGRRRYLAGPSALLALLFLGACTPEVSPTGIWALRTVNGSDLPARISQDANSTTDIERGLLLVRIESVLFDATYVTTVGGTPQQPEQVAIAGTWEGTGSQIAFTFSQTNTSVGTFEGEFMTVTDQDGMVFVYERV